MSYLAISTSFEYLCYAWVYKYLIYSVDVKSVPTLKELITIMTIVVFNPFNKKIQSQLFGMKFVFKRQDL